MTSANPSGWVLRRPRLRESQALAEALGCSRALGQLLVNRGLADPDAARRWLERKLVDLAEPELLPDLGAAAAAVAGAIRAGKRILVYGDYDVDGLCGAALLVRLFAVLGVTVGTYVPNRLTDGYGLREQALARIREQGYDLVITVDTGTSAHGPIAAARRLGLEVIVTDHHEPSGALPEGALIVNPKRADSAYPDRALSGTGVAFHLAWGIARAVSGQTRVGEPLRRFLVECLPLVAMATVADVMPLVGANRILVAEGLRALGARPSPGLQALVDVARLKRPISSTDVAFQLAPRLNAAGRLGHSELAFELLVTSDERRARILAAQLDADNRRRREVESEIVERVVTSLEARGEQESSVIVVGERGWHSGVIGIVAARLVERYQRPAMVASFDDTGLGRGSCRTVAGFELHTALAACGEHLLAHGGHGQAAGFEVREERFADFRAAMIEYGRSLSLPRVTTAPPLVVDALLDLDHVDERLVAELARLEPFGEGNPQPVFAARGVRVAGRPERVGKTGAHLSVHLRQGERAVRAIGFRMGELAERIVRTELDVVFAVQAGSAGRSAEVELKAVRPAAADRVDRIDVAAPAASTNA